MMCGQVILQILQPQNGIYSLHQLGYSSSVTFLLSFFYVTGVYLYAVLPYGIVYIHI